MRCKQCAHKQSDHLELVGCTVVKEVIGADLLICDCADELDEGVSFDDKDEV